MCIIVCVTTCLSIQAEFYKPIYNPSIGAVMYGATQFLVYVDALHDKCVFCAWHPHGMHVHIQSRNETAIFTKILFNKVFNADSMYFLVTIGVAFFKCIFANVFRGDKIYNMRLVHKRDGIKYVCMRYISFGNGVFAAIHAAVVATLYCPYTAV